MLTTEASVNSRDVDDRASSLWRLSRPFGVSFWPWLFSTNTVSLREAGLICSREASYQTPISCLWKPSLSLSAHEKGEVTSKDSLKKGSFSSHVSTS